MKSLFALIVLTTAWISTASAGGNPNVCDPKATEGCLLRCFLPGPATLEIYIGPADTDGQSAYLVQKSRLLASGLKIAREGKAVRPKPVTHTGGSMTLQASFDDGEITFDVTSLGVPTDENGWQLDGSVAVVGKSQDMICDYETKLWIEEYELKFSQTFPRDFYEKIKDLVQ